MRTKLFITNEIVEILNSSLLITTIFLIPLVIKGIAPITISIAILLFGISLYIISKIITNKIKQMDEEIETDREDARVYAMRVVDMRRRQREREISRTNRVVPFWNTDKPKNNVWSNEDEDLFKIE